MSRLAALFVMGLTGLAVSGCNGCDLTDCSCTSGCFDDCVSECGACSACGDCECACEGCSIIPIPGGYPASERIPQATQVRLSAAGLEFVEQNLWGTFLFVQFPASVTWIIAGVLFWLDWQLFVVGLATLPFSMWALVLYRRQLDTRVTDLRERSASIAKSPASSRRRRGSASGSIRSRPAPIAWIRP